MENNNYNPQIPFCLPIRVDSKDEVLKAIEENLLLYTYFEVWLDYIENLDDKFIKTLTDLVGSRLVMVFRREGQPAKMKKEDTLVILENLSQTKILVDLDIYNQKEILSEVKRKNIALETIISYHNYEKTPAIPELLAIIAEMETQNPTILKISTLCQTNEDALNLMEILVSLKKKNKKYIILGMGDKGLITRIFGTLWGNTMLFAPIQKSEETAPGQMTREKLDNIFMAIKNTYGK